MAASRYLIVNADDFGLSPGVNRGVIEAHERGIVTSTSMMVRTLAAAEAADYGRSHPDLSVGLHVDLGEWTYRGETWIPLYEVVPLGDGAAVAHEVSRQLAAFRRLVGADPTHLDSHQHVHRREPVCSVLREVAAGLGVPLRHFSSRIRYCGDFYGQTAEGRPLPDAVTADALSATVAALPPGITELACHPGDGEDLPTMYRGERALELQALCEPRVRAAIFAQGVQLLSFGNIDGQPHE